MIRPPPISTLFPYTTLFRSIPPRPPGFGRHRELFPRTTGDGFDPLSPAMVAADVTVGFVLQLDRSARMRSEEHTSELQSQSNLVCRLLLEKKNILQKLAQPV